MDKKDRIEIRDLRAKERFFLDDEFFNGYVRILGPSALCVYCSLCRHANKEQKAWPSQRRIAQELHISKPTVVEWIKVLEYFRIIKKVRIGRQCVNRYYLLDKKVWRRDWEVMLHELTSGEVKLFNFRSKTILLHGLNGLTSNRKDIHSKETQRKDQNESETFFQKYIPLNPLLKVLSEEEIKHALKTLGFDEFYIKKILRHIGKAYITEWLQALQYAHVESKTRYLANVCNQAMTGKYHALPKGYIQKIEEGNRRDNDSVITAFRKLPYDEKEKYLRLSRKKSNGVVKNSLALEIVAAYRWKNDALTLK